MTSDSRDRVWVRRPGWVKPPALRSQQQIHLDVWVDDLSAAHDRVIELGARLLQMSSDPGAPEQFQVYADPAGHPFCLCWGAADPED